MLFPYVYTAIKSNRITKIFAKAVNCLHPQNGDPCGECEICKGIDNGSILDAVSYTHLDVYKRQVYTLLNVDRGVPEVWGSTSDVRDMLNATVKLRAGKKINDMDLPLITRLAMKEALKKIECTDLEKILKEYNAI